MMRDTRGTVVLEALVAFVPLLLLFLTLCQLADSYAHRLMVRRAASAAARAAVVVLPDDGDHYGDPEQHGVDRPTSARLTAIEQAARVILSASPSFPPARIAVRVTGSKRALGITTATVEAEYVCFLPAVSLICGRARTLQMSARASLPYQAAPYEYAKGG